MSGAVHPSNAVIVEMVNCSAAEDAGGQAITSSEGVFVLQSCSETMRNFDARSDARLADAFTDQPAGRTHLKVVCIFIHRCRLLWHVTETFVHTGDHQFSGLETTVEFEHLPQPLVHVRSGVNAEQPSERKG